MEQQGGAGGSWSIIPNPNPSQPTNFDQSHRHQSLASQFHLIHLIENLADAIESGTRDKHSDALISDLSSQFERCHQLLNQISGSICSKSVTSEGQKHKVEECEQLLKHRRELVSQYNNSVEELTKSDFTR